VLLDAWLSSKRPGRATEPTGSPTRPAKALAGRAAPLGDDCALVQVGSEQLAVSTDLVVEGTHFREGWLEPAELGWRAAAAALSDLAAVAAEPLGVLASVGLPADRPEAHLEEVMGGVADAAQAVGALVWGGDLVRSERMVLDVAVVGRVDRPLRRSGAARESDSAPDRVSTASDSAVRSPGLMPGRKPPYFFRLSAVSFGLNTTAV